MNLISKPPQVATRWDKTFLLILFIVIPIVFLSIPTSFNRQNQFPDHPLPKATDLLPSLIFTVIMCILRLIFADRLFLKIAPYMVHRKPDWNDEYTKFRYERFGITLFKFIYFAFVTPLGIFLFRNEDWLPHILFGKGKGDMMLIYENFPYVPQIPYLPLYYCIEMSYHLHSLIFHICSPPRNDYYDSLLHHLLTIFLIVFSYLNVCARLGVCVMILHDIVDAIMYFTKCTNDCKNQIPASIGFILLATSYVKYRLYALAVYIIPIGYRAKEVIPEGTVGGYIAYYLLVGMLCALFIVHIYWYKLIIDMIFKFVGKKGVVDPHGTKQKPKEF